MAETVIPKIGLTPSQWNTYKTELFKKEANPTQGYQSIGGAGGRYIGGYQVSDSALADAGYLRNGSATGKPGFAWKDNNNWLKPNGDPITPGIRNYQDFLNNPQAQDDALFKFTSRNATSLTKFGIINDDVPPSQRAGELAASHLLGPTGRNRDGIDGKDGFGTPARKYYDDIGKAVGGGQTAPPAPINAAGTRTTPGRTASGQGGSSSSGSFRGSGTSLGASSNILSRAIPVTIAREDSDGTEDIPINLPNPLEEFQSYNYLFTLSSLTAEAINFPRRSYLAGDLGRIIFSSAGRYSENRVETAYINPENPAGKYEFFIDNVVMKHLVTPSQSIGSTNLLEINFEITEPYSVGQFLQSCQIAADQNGHYSYVDSPFLLTLEFRGYRDGDRIGIPGTTKFIPVQFRSVTVTMSESGTKYQVGMIAWTDQIYDDEFNKLKQDSVISGKSVVEMLQTGERSLQNIINNRLKKIAVDNKKYVPDEIVILFPGKDEEPSVAPSEPKGAVTSSSSSGDVLSRIKLNRDNKTQLVIQAAGSVNEIGNAIFNFDATSGGDVPKQDDTPLVIKGLSNKKIPRNSFNNNYSQREFTFRKETTIVNAITEVLLMSEYCAGIVNAKPDASGRYNWFRIEAQAYSLTPNENNKAVGIFPKLFVFRVVPYKVHMSKFQTPDVTPIGYKQLANGAVKEYNYIYTGKNVDVLDFKLNLNVNFGTNVLADGLGQYSQSALMNSLGKTGAGFDDKSTAYVANPQAAAPGAGAGDPTQAIPRQRANPGRWKTSDGAGLADNYRTKVARQFQHRMLNGDAEKVSASLSILGDPYYISDSGIGNYSNSNYNTNLNLTDSGSFDYQKGEVDIIFNFLTPVDLSESGRLLFDKDSATTLEVPFSGLYFIISATSTFSRGKFTQVLDLARRPNQNTEGTLNGVNSEGQNVTIRNSDGSTTNPESGVTTPKPGAAAAETNVSESPVLNFGEGNDARPFTASNESPIQNA